jgi:ribonucleotide reductase beta subunit family protein with ferritin-like domain
MTAVVARHFDPILDTVPGERRNYCLFPVKYPRLFEMYEKAQASYWTAAEVDLSRDRMHFEKLSAAEQHFLKCVLGFFSAADGMVNENLSCNFSAEVVPQEILSFYSFQSAIEAVHAEVYSKLIDSVIADESEKHALFDALETMPVVAAKAEWMRNYMSADTPFEERLVAFSCAEGILFSASFASIFFFKRRGIMPGLCFSNELISRDEGLHCQFAVLLHNHLQNKASAARIVEIVKGSVEVESAFVQEALSSDLLGMNARDMIQYVQFVADRLLLDYGCDKAYGVQNPFPWMNQISLQGISDFFCKRVGEYSKAGVGVSQEDNTFCTEADF